MPRYDFVDWMKALGIGVIVYGHVAHATTVPLTPPIYLKQLGVVCFLFVTGFTLARERRGTGEVLFGRLFQVYLFGTLAALLITIAGLVSGSGLALSNFLPLAGGANVLFDNFPANPTTWYLGTYLHLLVIWAIWLRRVRVRMWMVVAAVALEIPIRAALISWAGPYIAYMLFTNWMAVFLFGLMQGARSEAEPRTSAMPYALALVLGGAAWAVTLGLAGFTPTFPFMTLETLPAILSAPVVSMAVSFLYLITGALVFAAARRIAAPGLVRFIARNSLIIFIAHMPIFLLLHPQLVALGLSYWSRVAIDLLVCLPGLALVSEGILRSVNLKSLGARLFAALSAGRVANPRGVAGAPSWGNR